MQRRGKRSDYEYNRKSLCACGYTAAGGRRYEQMGSGRLRPVHISARVLEKGGADGGGQSLSTEADTSRGIS